MWRRRPKIYYLAPDLERPSWGVGLIYVHARILRAHGYDTEIVHVDRPFRPTWIEVEAPIRNLTSRFFRPRARDLLVVSEIMAESRAVGRLRCRKLIFVQNVFLILARRETSRAYHELGYEAAITILPHLGEVLKRFFGTEAHVVRPFVAPCFFSEPSGAARLQEVLFYPKAGCQDVGILTRFLERELPAQGWRVKELDGLDHRGVACAMHRASFYACVNDREAFKTTVPEAMAAGCIPFCYEAFGGRDYLIDGVNSRVFPNHDLFPLVNALLETIDHLEEREDEIRRLRRGGRATAAEYVEETTEAELLRCFEQLLGGES